MGGAIAVPQQRQRIDEIFAAIRAELWKRNRNRSLVVGRVKPNRRQDKESSLLAIDCMIALEVHGYDPDEVDVLKRLTPKDR